ncbi:MAG: hypothetical protein HKL91_04730 [Candidatus Eremiobacteraeota bacterium]|nr:hypothetical protein [Candidatus Eremiobacteraeota bacterium]
MAVQTLSQPISESLLVTLCHLREVYEDLADICNKFEPVVDELREGSNTIVCGIRDGSLPSKDELTNLHGSARRFLEIVSQDGGASRAANNLELLLGLAVRLPNGDVIDASEAKLHPFAYSESMFGATGEIEEVGYKA